mmetsp:Transcript_95107/g.254144  ORF Transcript_95107/g.254144 Transcript_95107/m.254144 type:complete len:351 (+) Transcript_95107:4556-5608(+)
MGDGRHVGDHGAAGLGVLAQHEVVIIVCDHSVRDCVARHVVSVQVTPRQGAVHVETSAIDPSSAFFLAALPRQAERLPIQVRSRVQAQGAFAIAIVHATRLSIRQEHGSHHLRPRATSPTGTASLARYCAVFTGGESPPVGVHVGLRGLAAVGAVPEPLVVHARVPIRFFPTVPVIQLPVPADFLLPRRNLRCTLGQALVGLHSREIPFHRIQVPQGAEPRMLGLEAMLPLLLDSVVVELGGLQVAISNCVQIAPWLGLVHVNRHALRRILTELLTRRSGHAECILLRQERFVIPFTEGIGGWIHAGALDKTHLIPDGGDGLESHHILPCAEHSSLMGEASCAGRTDPLY